MSSPIQSQLIDELKCMLSPGALKKMDADKRRLRRSHAIQAAISPSLRKIYSYLDELRIHANLLPEPVSVNYHLKHYGVLMGLKQQGYTLRSGGDDPFNTLIFSLNLYNGRQHRMRFKQPLESPLSIERLLKEGINIVSLEEGELEPNARQYDLTVMGNVPVYLTFKADQYTGSIGLTVQNFDVVGKLRYSLVIEKITDTMLDHLGRILLRQPGYGFKSKMDWGYREVMDSDPTTTLLGVDTRKALIDTAEIFSSKLRSIFAKKMIRLRIRGREHVFRSSELPCRIGRRPPAELTVNSTYTSRMHAVVGFEQDHFYVKDHSSNGTFIHPDNEEPFKLVNDYYRFNGRGAISLGRPVSDEDPYIIYYSVT